MQAATAMQVWFTDEWGEAKVFSYGDYASATPGNYEYQRNTYGYDIPDCIRGNGWIK